jgi:hypothetical protein
MPISVEPGIKAKGREISETEDHSCLRESQSFLSASKAQLHISRLEKMV